MRALMRRLFVPMMFLVASCTMCTPPTNNPPTTLRGPGRAGTKQVVVANAGRVRGPAVTGSVSAQRTGSLTQGLLDNCAARSINVNLTGADTNFAAMYFFLGPLYQPKDVTEDGGPTRFFEEVVVPAAIFKVLPNGGTEVFHCFAVEDEHRYLHIGADQEPLKWFQSTGTSPIEINGVLYDDPKFLLSKTAVDGDGNVYLALNTWMEIFKFSPQGERSVFLTLETPPSDIIFTGTDFLISQLPEISTPTGVTTVPDGDGGMREVLLGNVIMKPRIIRVGLDGSILETITEFPDTYAAYMSRAKDFNTLDADGGIISQRHTPLNLSLSMARTPDALYITSNLEGVVYKHTPDAGLTPFLTGQPGVSSMSTSPATDWLYMTIPGVIRTTMSDPATWEHIRMPSIRAFSPTGEVTDFTEMDEYLALTPLESSNGIADSDNRNISVLHAQQHTVITDSSGNLILSDPVRNEIVLVPVVAADADGGAAP